MCLVGVCSGSVVFGEWATGVIINVSHLNVPEQGADCVCMCMKAEQCRNWQASWKAAKLFLSKSFMIMTDYPDRDSSLNGKVTWFYLGSGVFLNLHFQEMREIYSIGNEVISYNIHTYLENIHTESIRGTLAMKNTPLMGYHFIAAHIQWFTPRHNFASSFTAMLLGGVRKQESLGKPTQIQWTTWTVTRAQNWNRNHHCKLASLPTDLGYSVV